MRSFVTVTFMFLGGVAASFGYGFGHEVAAEPPAIPTMVYDCRKTTAAATMVTCACLQGSEIWTCTFPAHRGSKRGIKGKEQVR